MKKSIIILLIFSLNIVGCYKPPSETPIVPMYDYREAFVNAPIIDAQKFYSLRSEYWNFGARFIDSIVAVYPQQYGLLDFYNQVPYPYRLGTKYGIFADKTFVGCFRHSVESGLPSKRIYEFAIPLIIKNIIVDEGVRIYLHYYECINQPIEYINSTADPRDIFVKSDNTKFSEDEFSRMFRKINSLDESQYWSNRVCFTDIEDRGDNVFSYRFERYEYSNLSSFDEYNNEGIIGDGFHVHHFQKSDEKCNPSQW